MCVCVFHPDPPPPPPLLYPQERWLCPEMSASPLSLTTSSLPVKEILHRYVASRTRPAGLQARREVIEGGIPPSLWRQRSCRDNI